VRTLIGCLAILILSACGPSGAKSTAGGAATDSTARLAHEAYTAAINSNNLDSLAGMFTEDVVFLAAHAPPIVGKAAVRAWAEGYLQAFTTHGDKASQEFVVAYKSTDTPKAGGAKVVDTGWGLVIYNHDADRKWRVARDAFSTDTALPTK
jgi:ketosteroid isomerase-like protein